MEFPTLRDEQQFDHYCSEWITKYRFPGTEPLALVMQRAHANMGNGLPSISLFERAYRELHKEARVPLITEKMSVPKDEVRSRLTKSEYDSMSIHEIRQRYNQDASFRSDVDELIKTGKVG